MTAPGYQPLPVAAANPTSAFSAQGPQQQASPVSMAAQIVQQHLGRPLTPADYPLVQQVLAQISPGTAAQQQQQPQQQSQVGDLVRSLLEAKGAQATASGAAAPAVKPVATELGNMAFNAPGSTATIASNEAAATQTALDTLGGNAPAVTSEWPTGAAAMSQEPVDAAAADAGSLGALPAAAVIAGTVLGGRSGLKMLNGKMKPWQKESLSDKAGRVTLGVATGGLSEVANKLLGGHKSTSAVRNGHTSDLEAQFADDPNYQNFVHSSRDQHTADPSHPFHNGDYATFDEYKKAGLDANDLTGTYGNLDAFGQEYTNLNDAQRQAVTQAIINEGLYSSSKGEVNITDKARAKQIFDSVKAGGFQTQPKPQVMIPAGGGLPSIPGVAGKTFQPDPGFAPGAFNSNVMQQPILRVAPGKVPNDLMIPKAPAAPPAKLPKPPRMNIYDQLKAEGK